MRMVHPGAGGERGHEADLERNKWKIFIPCGQRCSKTAVLQLCAQGSKTLTVTFGNAVTLYLHTRGRL